MKKIVTLLFAVVSMNTIKSQNYYLSDYNGGKNPGALNNDIEQGSTTGWATIHTGPATPTPAWSSNVTIPFSFSFNGSVEASYKVATSGVLTFNIAAGTAPVSANIAIPSASLPDKSVCVWGLESNGANDIIRYKTFGTSPNRQHWIQFCSYTAPGYTSGSTVFSYWAIVLEETTNNIYIVDQRTAGMPNLSLTLGVQVNSTTATQVVGSPNISSNAATYADDTPIDNVYYKFSYGVQPAAEAALFVINPIPTQIIPAAVNISGVIINYGSAPITQINLVYKSGVNTYSVTKSGLNIASGSSYNFTHNTPFNVSTANNYPIKVWIELNGDVKHTNDTLSTTIVAYSFLTDKKIVFEEATGSWCGWCVRGAVYMEQMENLHPDKALLIAIHNNDPMADATYDAGFAPLHPSGFPSSAVNRDITDIDPTYFPDVYDAIINDIVPCNTGVTANYNYATNNITINVSALFAGPLSGDYRFNAVVTENNVTGTTSGYNQTNYYSGNGYGPMSGAGHNWAAETNPVAAANMVYDHVARSILGGFSGTSGSLPTTINTNDNLSKQYVYNVPAGYNVANMEVIGFVSNATTGKILNGAKTAVTIPLKVEENNELNFGAEIYPNPISGNNGNLILNLKEKANVSIEIFDVVGKLIKSEEKNNLPAGMHTFIMDMQDLNIGIYNVKVTTEKGSVIKRIIVSQ